MNSREASPSLSIAPARLKPGDEVRVLALSRSLGGLLRQGTMAEEQIASASARLESLGLRVTFGAHIWDCNEHLTASTEDRITDLHEAITSPSVSAVLAATGGIGAIQLLDHIGYASISRLPKILCGYSDVAYIGNAIHARSNVVTYYGPNFSTFAMPDPNSYTLEQFRKCLFSPEPFVLAPAAEWADAPQPSNGADWELLPNEGWWILQEGVAEGTCIGGSHFVLNMLHGSDYAPAFGNTILFLEHPAEGKATLMALDSRLRALAFQPSFASVRGIVFGRYARAGRVSRGALAQVVGAIPALAGKPIIANCDFGHTYPMATLPIGGHCQIHAEGTAATIGFSHH